MTYLLDTNVVSEWIKPRPDAGVTQWLASVEEDDVFISVVTLAELRQGVERLAVGRRRTQLDEWLREDLPVRFQGRVVAIDAAVADVWGRVLAQGFNAGRPIQAFDACVAACALSAGATLVTRNTAHFDHLGMDLLNPWSI